MIEKYEKDVQDWPRPTSCREMSSFLGFAGYYPGFIPRYTALTNRMNSMKKAEKLKQSDDMERDFKESKAEPFKLTINWSPLNIAGVLSQKQEGVDHFIVCWGRKCNHFEKP